MSKMGIRRLRPRQSTLLKSPSWRRSCLLRIKMIWSRLSHRNQWVAAPHPTPASMDIIWSINKRLVLIIYSRSSRRKYQKIVSNNTSQSSVQIRLFLWGDSSTGGIPQKAASRSSTIAARKMRATGYTKKTRAGCKFRQCPWSIVIRARLSYYLCRKKVSRMSSTQS